MPGLIYLLTNPAPPIGLADHEGLGFDGSNLYTVNLGGTVTVYLTETETIALADAAEAAAIAASQPLSANLTAFSSKTAPGGDVVGTTDSQALTNKTYNGYTFTAGSATVQFLNNFEYSENTWTPALSGSGTLPTFSTNSGTYSRSGNLVSCNAYLNNTSGGTAGSGASQLSISVPFTTSAIQLPVRIQVGTVQNNTDEYLIYATLAPSVSALPLWKATASGGNIALVALTPNDLNHANTRQLSMVVEFMV